jgi:putative membrane protein
MKHSVIPSALLALTFVGPALAGASGGYDHPHMFGANGFGMFLGPVFMLVLLAALIVGVVVLIRWITSGSGFSDEKDNNALNTLNLRFANGEMDAKEYAERKKLLIG